MGQRLLLASHNRGKLAELATLLAGLPVELLGAGDLGLPVPEETAGSFVENALLKARHASAYSGLPALADDSGLLVEGLGGAPGVRSARFAGAGADDRQNNEALLAAAAGLEGGQRRCRFACVLVLLSHAEDPLPLIAQGVWEGRLLRTPRGQGGFGYDPLFLDVDSGLSAAEMDAAQKAQRSHRGQAMRLLSEGLAARLGR